jgi:hypothetical protein
MAEASFKGPEDNVCVLCEAIAMRTKAQLHFAGGRERLFSRARSLIYLPLFILVCVFTATAQQAHPESGAISAQDLGKITAPAVSGSDAADQACARFATCSIVSAPSELKSQNHDSVELVIARQQRDQE